MLARKIITTILYCISCLFFSLYAIYDAFFITGFFFGFTESNATVFLEGIFGTLIIYILIFRSYGKSKKTIGFMPLLPIAVSQLMFTQADSFTEHGKVYLIFAAMLIAEAAYAVSILIKDIKDC